MHIEDNPILCSDQLWSALQRAITALTDRPKSALGYRRNTEDGLNIIAINSLAKDAKLSDRPVFEVREERGKDARVVRRWLQVNHPGHADPIRNVKILERIYLTPIPPSIVDRIIAYLKAWQSARAEQLIKQRPAKAKRKRQRLGIRGLTDKQKRARDLKDRRFTHAQIAEKMNLRNESSVTALLKRAQLADQRMAAEVRRERASGHSIRSNVSLDSLEGGDSAD